jgi:hypothetical protein
MVVEAGVSASSLAEVARPEDPVDTNAPQSFELKPTDSPVKFMKVTFNGSTDMFGRVTIYTCKVCGF